MRFKRNISTDIVYDSDGLCVFQELAHGWILIGSPSLSLLPKKVSQRVLTYLAAEERCHPRYGEDEPHHLHKG